MAEGGNVPELGGYDYEFTSNVPEYWECLVCHLTLKDPVQIEKCGHRLCSICMESLFRRPSPTCPADRQPLSREEIFSDNACHRQILDLIVKCSHSGCSWTGELRAVEKHQSECLFKVVKCPNSGCAMMLSKRDMKTHEISECPWRKVNCEYCQESVIMNQKQKHFDICREFPVVCTNKCGVKDVPREKLEVHFRDECPATEVQCEYKNLGCEEVFPRSDAKFHSQTRIESHLNLALRGLEVTQHKVQELVTVVKDQSQQMKRQSGQIEGQSGQIEQLSQHIERLISKDKEQSQQIERQSQQIEQQSQHIERLVSKDKEQPQQIERQSQHIERLVSKDKEQSQQIERQSQQIERLMSKDKEQSQHIERLESKDKEQSQQIERQSQHIERLVSKDKEQSQLMERQSQQIERLMSKDKEQSQQMERQSQHIERLESKDKEQSQQTERQSKQIEQQLQQIERQSQQIERQSEQLKRQSENIEKPMSLVQNQPLQKEQSGPISQIYLAPIEWKIPNIRNIFQRAKRDHETQSLASKPFYLFEPSYKYILRIRIFPDQIGSFATLYMHIKVVPGEFDELLSWPCKEKVRVTFVDQDPLQKNRKDISHVIDFEKDTKPCYQPLLRDDDHDYRSILVLRSVDLLHGSYIDNDTLLIKVKRE